MSKFTALNLSPDKINMKYLSIPIKPDTTIRDINTLLSNKFGIPVELYRVGPKINLLSDLLNVEYILDNFRRTTNYQILGFKVKPQKVKPQKVEKLQTSDNLSVTSNISLKSESLFPFTQNETEDRRLLLSLLNILQNWNVNKPTPRDLMATSGILRRWNLLQKLPDLQKDANYRQEVIRDISDKLGLKYVDKNLTDELSVLSEELKIEIISKLSINDIVSLSATNTYYRSLILDTEIINTKAQELNYTLDNSLSLDDQWRDLLKYHDQNYYGPRCLQVNEPYKCITLAIEAGNYEEFVKLYSERYGEIFDDAVFREIILNNQPEMAEYITNREDFDRTKVKWALIYLCSEYDKYDGYSLAIKLVEMLNNDPDENPDLEARDLYYYVFDTSVVAGWWDIVYFAGRRIMLGHVRCPDSSKRNREIMNYVIKGLRKHYQYVLYDKNLSTYSDSELFIDRQILMQIAFKKGAEDLANWLSSVDDNLKLENLGPEMTEVLLLQAIEGNQLGMLQKILNTGLRLNEIYVWTYAENASYDLIKALLYAGADPNLNYPILTYMDNERDDVVCLLLDYGANPKYLGGEAEYYFEKCRYSRVPSLQQKILQMRARGELEDYPFPPLFVLDPSEQRQSEIENNVVAI